MSDRLERHRVRCKLNGLPIYGRGFDVDGYDEDEIRGYVAEPEWKWSDLTTDEQAFVRADAETLRARSAGRTPDKPLTIDEAFWFSLGEYGISCPHDWRSDRKDDRSLVMWFECGWCKATRHPEGIPVQVGDQWLRVTDPPPPRLAIPRKVGPKVVAYDPDPSPIGAAIPIDEYRWNGHAYEIASR